MPPPTPPATPSATAPAGTLNAAADAAPGVAPDAAAGATPASFLIDVEGWCIAARRVPSPNQDARSDAAATDLLIIHNISLPPGQFGGHYIEDLFCNRLDPAADPYFAQIASLRVSAHFLIRRDGSLLQFVPTGARAWHAGISRFGERERCNDFSIGIELEGTDTDPFMPAQYATLAVLTVALQARHGLTHAAGHEHVAPGRKTDPGPCFDWDGYERHYLAALGTSSGPTAHSTAHSAVPAAAPAAPGTQSDTVSANAPTTVSDTALDPSATLQAALAASDSSPAPTAHTDTRLRFPQPSRKAWTV